MMTLSGGGLSGERFNAAIISGESKPFRAAVPDQQKDGKSESTGANAAEEGQDIFLQVLRVVMGVFDAEGDSFGEKEKDQGGKDLDQEAAAFTAAAPDLAENDGKAEAGETDVSAEVAEDDSTDE